LTPIQIAQLLSKWLKHDLGANLEIICYCLQGRPRFLASFLRIIREKEYSKQLNGLSPVAAIYGVFENYLGEMTTTQGEGTLSSLYNFWVDRAPLTIQPIAGSDSPQISVSDLLVSLCISFLFGDQNSMAFDVKCDLVNTGLVTVDYKDVWKAKMAEPLALTAGLNYLRGKSSGVLMKYFTDRLFSPMGAPRLTPQEKGNIMEMVVTLKILQYWWSRESMQEFLPEWIEEKLWLIPLPKGVIDCRCKDKQKITIDSFEPQLQNPDFPWIILSDDDAGLYIRYSFFSFSIKTTWTFDSKNTSIHVSEEEADKISRFTNPSQLYQSTPSLPNQDAERRFLHFRIELPYPAPSEKAQFVSNENVICVDLESPFAKAFFGNEFIEQYEKFISTKLPNK
jgi:hypothetical protein